MLKHLSVAALMYVSPSGALATNEEHLISKTEFCQYGGTPYSKGAILQIEGQPTLICTPADPLIREPGKKLALEWQDYEAWKKERS